jgi:acyl carrier protein
MGRGVIMNLDQLKDIVAEVCTGVDVDGITEDSRFEDIGIDSLDLAQVIFAVENALEISIDPDILEEVVTVGDALEAIQEAQR